MSAACAPNRRAAETLWLDKCGVMAALRLVTGSELEWELELLFLAPWKLTGDDEKAGGGGGGGGMDN